MGTKFVTISRVFSEALFGFLFQNGDYKWSRRDYLLMAGLSTFGGLVALMGCLVGLATHDYRFSAGSGAGAVAAGLVAVWTWSQWLADRRAA